MALLILAAFIAIPLVEIMVFIQVGSEIGALNTILITVVTAVIGLMLLRVQGLGALMRARAALEKQESPVNEIFEGVLLALAGLFLLIPGFVTDAIGFLLFLPPLRKTLAGYMARHSKFVATNMQYQGGRRSPPGKGPIIDGEYEVVDEDAPEIENHPSGPGNPESPWSDKK